MSWNDASGWLPRAWRHLSAGESRPSSCERSYWSSLRPTKLRPSAWSMRSERQDSAQGEAAGTNLGVYRCIRAKGRLMGLHGLPLPQGASAFSLALAPLDGVRRWTGLSIENVREKWQ